MKKCLPQSPQKKKEVIKSLASKFNMKVKLGQKIGRKNNVLSEQENQRLFNQTFLSLPLGEETKSILRYSLKSRGSPRNAISCGQ